MAYSLGIDLGTTYSAAATARDGRIEIFQLGERAATIPSIVVLRADGEVLVGDAAERRSLGEPTRTAREFKRRLGDPTPIILGGTPYGAESLLAHLLKAIVARVSEQSGGPPDAIVADPPRELRRLQDRPPRAGHPPGRRRERDPADRARGGRRPLRPAGARAGRRGHRRLRLRRRDVRRHDPAQDRGRLRAARATRGDGAPRRDRLRRGALHQRDGPGPRGRRRRSTRTTRPTLAAIARLREECRRAKEALSSDTDTTIQVVLPGLQTEMRLTREEFEEMIRPRITETIAALGRAAKSAGLGFDGVDRILLVGGSSRIPLVAEMVREATGRPIAVDAHPKHSMALGAAFVAEQRRLAAQADSEAAVARGCCGRRGGPGGGGGVRHGRRSVAVPGPVRIRRAVPPERPPRVRPSQGLPRSVRAGAGDAVPLPEPTLPERTLPRTLDRCAGLPPGTPVETAGGGAFPPTEVVPVVGAGTAVAASADGGPNRNRTIAAAAAVGGIAVVLLLGIGASGMLTGGAPSSPPASVAVVSPRAVGRPVGRADPVPHRGPDPERRPDADRRPDPDPDAGRSPGADHRDRDHQRSLRRRLRGVRLHAGAPRPPRPLLLRHRVRRRTPASPARGRGSCTPDPFRSPATRSATGPPAAKQMCILVANSNHSIVAEHRQLHGPALAHGWA